MAGYRRTVMVGPAGFRLVSPWRAPLDAIDRLYAGYPQAVMPDFTARLDPPHPWRRWLRPSFVPAGDYALDGAAPLPRRYGLLGLEMAMNLQMALGWRRHVLLHAASVERDGRALILTGVSGSGKSTLAAMLGERGWRLMSDEFVLLTLDATHVLPFPRPVSLKNEAVAAMIAMHVDPARFGPPLAGTPKGLVRHFRPRDAAIARMGEGAAPAHIVFPRFGAATAMRPVAPEELFMRLTQASTNYVALGEDGFGALLALCRAVPAHAVDYTDFAAAESVLDRLW